MLSSVRAIAGRALVTASATVLVLSTLPAAAAASLDELIELSQRAWGGEGELLAEVYAPEGVHTATFFDRTNTYEGPAEIAWVAGFGGVEPIGPRVDIPAAEGEYRWASFSTLGGGTACLFHAVEGRIVRHDCLVPERSNEARAAGALADGSTSAAIDELVARMELGWDSGSLEDLEAVYAPDAVHTARYLDTTRQYVGPAEIAWVAGYGAPQPIGPRVELAAPEGELAWAQVSGAVGGTVCLFHAVEGLVTRHDCVLPVAS